MAYAAVAMMAWGLYADSQKNKALAQATLADNKLKLKRLEIIKDRQGEAFEMNKSLVNRAELANASAIEESRLQGQSDVTSGLAGSGLGGESIDDISTQVAIDAAKASNENIRQADENRQSLFREREDQLEDIKSQADNLSSFDMKAANKASLYNSIGTGLQVAVQTGAFDSKGPKPKVTTKGAK